MAKPVLKAVLFPFLVMLSLLFSYSSARVLHNHLLHNSASLNLAYPSDIVMEASENPWELKDSGKHVSPSDMEPKKMSGSRIPSRISGKYGRMFLSMLPKGSIPTSGPSGGTNSLNN